MRINPLTFLSLALATTVFAHPQTQSKERNSLTPKSVRYVASSQYTIDLSFDTITNIMTAVLTTKDIWGFCGIGISSGGINAMTGADIAFVRFEDDQCKLTDSYGTGPVAPTADTQISDLTLLGCEYLDGAKIVTFSRPYNTGDNSGQDHILESGTTETFIWAYGANAGDTSHTPNSRGTFTVAIP